jgi:hypothetical protein
MSRLLASCAILRASFHELVEQRSVMPHRLSQVFGSRAVVVGIRRESVALAIVLDDARMVYGEVGSSLIKLLDWVSSIRHHSLKQAVRSSDGASRLVDELGLDDPPLLDVSRSRLLRERSDVECLVPLFASGELCFRFTPTVG